jgi:cell division protein FtsL
VETLDRRGLDPRYVTYDSFREHCDNCKAANQEQRRIIVDNAMDRFENLEDGIKECELELEKYKEVINGKFDRIWRSTIFLLITIVLSLVGTIWTQHSNKADLDSKFKVLIEGRAYHQGVSENNSEDLKNLKNEMNDLKGKFIPAGGKK